MHPNRSGVHPPQVFETATRRITKSQNNSTSRIRLDAEQKERAIAKLLKSEFGTKEVILFKSLAQHVDFMRWSDIRSGLRRHSSGRFLTARQAQEHRSGRQSAMKDPELSGLARRIRQKVDEPQWALERISVGWSRARNTEDEICVNNLDTEVLV